MTSPDQPASGQIGQQPLHALIDTNVMLDWLLDRSPWADEARPFWHAQSAGLIVGYAPASAVTDLFYIARRSKDYLSAFAAVDRVLASLEIIAVDRMLLQAARALSGNDFEDNVQIACAQAAHLDLIVTRDASGFAHAALPAMAPPDVVRYLSPNR